MSKRHERQQRQRQGFARRGPRYVVSPEIVLLPHMKSRWDYYVLDRDTNEMVGGPYGDREPAERRAKQLNRAAK